MKNDRRGTTGTPDEAGGEPFQPERLLQEARLLLSRGGLLSHKPHATRTTLDVLALVCDEDGRVNGVHVLGVVQGGRWALTTDCGCRALPICRHVVCVLEATRRSHPQFDTDVDGYVTSLATGAAAVLQAAPRELTAPPGKRSVPSSSVPPAADVVRGKAQPAPTAWSKWLNGFQSQVKVAKALPAPQDKPVEQVVVFQLRISGQTPSIELFLVEPTKITDSRRWAQPVLPGDFSQNPRIRSLVSEEDLLLVRLIAMERLATPWARERTTELSGPQCLRLLKDLLATGRCGLRQGSGPFRPLKEGGARIARPVWKFGPEGVQRTAVDVVPAADQVFVLETLWYLDTAAAEVGLAETPLPPQAIRAWLNAPPLQPEESGAVAALLGGEGQPSGMPVPTGVKAVTLPLVPPVPRLSLSSVEVYPEFSPFRRNDYQAVTVHLAQLSYVYPMGMVDFRTKARTHREFKDGVMTCWSRDLEAEQEAEDTLEDLGFFPVSEAYPEHDFRKQPQALSLLEEGEWFDFLGNPRKALEEKGWEIVEDPSFKLRLAEAEDWVATTQEGNGQGADWFGFELGVIVEGRKVNLMPLLLRAIRQSPETWSLEAIQAMADKDLVHLRMDDDRLLPFPAGRLKQVLGVLFELHQPEAVLDEGRLRINRHRAVEFCQSKRWNWNGPERLRELALKLSTFKEIRPISPPRHLKADLRPYQLEGVSWLRFLVEHGLSGILADDMGLGKTIQTLAFLAHEKEAGNLARPCLVIAPTSLVHTWHDEAAKFTPRLRVLVSHGLERKARLEELEKCDVVITSYPLLPRDKEFLLAQHFHMVILDEAQVIKNPKAQWTEVACALKADHRLCLTGTPMENHLGELWSLFHFLMPGLLGDAKSFHVQFRKPIERGNDVVRRQLLSRRISSLILRRRKDQVEKDLPTKTEILRTVELSGDQRDLYESIRLAMHRKVSEAIDAKGINRVQIVLLDALLKLRQVCCDPRLVKLAAARNVKESAKLELLTGMLPTLIEEGRRILLFSQFTSMLDLIEPELEKLGIPFVRLTGETTDRATPVRRFQAGEVPLFLISLKAGGTGLTLTAADVVIHFDPWWNPAVESQATDRAHRIGQTKPVFVYKFVTAGTVEERILALQDRKKALVSAILNEERHQGFHIERADIDALFSPIHDSPPASKVS